MYVVDCSDPSFRSQLNVTQSVLAEIGANQAPSRILLNKVDRVDEAARAELAGEYPEALLLSAKDPADVARLRESIIAFFEAGFEETTLLIPYTRGNVAGQVRSSMRVLREAFEDDGTHLTVRAPHADIARIRSLLD